MLRLRRKILLPMRRAGGVRGFTCQFRFGAGTLNDAFDLAEAFGNILRVDDGRIDTEVEVNSLVDVGRCSGIARRTGIRGMVYFSGSAPARVPAKRPEALARSAVADALFFSEKAVKADPESVEACRLMADALATAKAPECVFWRA